MYIYIDTSLNKIIHLFDNNFSLVDSDYNTSKRTGTSLQSTLFEMLQKHSLKNENIDGWFFNSGPGSYTGLRVSEGLAQVMELENYKVFSFYSFDIPSLAGINTGTWVTKAFKGQVFIYSWNNIKSEKRLCDNKDFDMQEFESIFYHSEIPFNDNSTKKSWIDSSKLINEKAKIIFPKIIESRKRNEPFYFRDPEQEFKVSFP